MRAGMGGKFEWAKVTKDEIKALSGKMFDAANVPSHVRSGYWQAFQGKYGLF